MKANILMTIFSMLVLGNINGQTSISTGPVSGTWAKANSPYLIQGSIVIANGSTLTIEPGVTIIFQGNYKLLCAGRLLAAGRMSDTIIFTASDTSVGWFGLNFDNTPATNDTSKILYCKLQHVKNKSGSGGGALYFNNFSKAVVSHSLIWYNLTSAPNGRTSSGNEGAGGGIYCKNNSNPVISFNNISFNQSYTGGGIDCYSSSPVIADNTISNNTAYYENGGGINCNFSGVTIINNRIFNNTASTAGGGISVGSINASSVISNNIISNNLASSGGGIFSEIGVNSVISNNIISNNNALRDGGGISFFASDPDVSNNTICNNVAADGGGVYCNSSSPAFRNTILWGNSVSNEGKEVFLANEVSDPDFYYCDVMGGSSSFGLVSNIFFTGAFSHNIDSAPGFVMPPGGNGNAFDGMAANWLLQNTSPCINTGDLNGMYAATDIFGNQRISGGRIDIGACEFQSSTGLKDNITAYADQFTIFPNPAKSILNLRIGNILKEDGFIDILNSEGTRVQSQLARRNEKQIFINIDALPAGLYFLSLNGSTIQCSRKFVVE